MMYHVINYIKDEYTTLYESLDGAEEMRSAIENWEAIAVRMPERRQGFTYILQSKRRIGPRKLGKRELAIRKKEEGV